MTDARLPDRWLTDRRLLRLTDSAFRLYVTSLMWSVANKTDGVLYDDDLPLIPRADPGCHDQLAKAGLWKREWDRWLIIDYADTQTSASELDALAARRRADRKRKAAERQRKAASRDASRDSHAESLRTGQARQGQAPRSEAPGTTAAPDGASRAPDVAEQRRAAEGGTHRYEPAPSHSQSEHDGSDNDGPDAQQIPAVVHLQSQAADRYAREASAADARDAADWERDHPGVPMRPRNCMTCWESTDRPGRCDECRAKLAAAGIAS